MFCKAVRTDSRHCASSCLPAKAFMVGLISRMDALVGAPLESILTESGADEDIREALLQRSGRLGKLLQLADAVEQDDQQKILVLLKDLKISSTLLNRCVFIYKVKIFFSSNRV